jgi:mycothiol system anti-sigma-R factor
MDCDKAADRMHHYLDGELRVWRRVTITRHLRRCPPCAQGYVFEIEVRQIVASRCRDEMPPELKQRITDALTSGAAFDESPVRRTKSGELG